jgi:hypothetical protein
MKLVSYLEIAQGRLYEIRDFVLRRIERIYELCALPRPTPPPLGLLANSKPILTGAGSVFNLAGTMDEPIVGLMQSGVNITDDEALELLPFYEDQAEHILSQTEKLMQSAERVLKVRRQLDEHEQKKKEALFRRVILAPPPEANRSETDQEETGHKSKRTS